MGKNEILFSAEGVEKVVLNRVGKRRGHGRLGTFGFATIVRQQ